MWCTACGEKDYPNLGRKKMKRIEKLATNLIKALQTRLKRTEILLEKEEGILSIGPITIEKDTTDNYLVLIWHEIPGTFDTPLDVSETEIGRFSNMYTALQAAMIAMTEDFIQDFYA